MQTGALTPDNATPGRILAAARTERGMSVSEVAQRLKFSIRHIEALEADRYDALPGGPFTRGMIRTYAKLLGLDAARLLEDVPQPEATGEPAMQPRDMSVPFPQDSRPGSRAYLLLSMLIIVAVVVVLAEWFIRSQRGAAEETAAAPVAGEPTEKAEPRADSSAMPAKAGAAQPQPANDEPAGQSSSASAATSSLAEVAPPAQPEAKAAPPGVATESPTALRSASARANGVDPARDSAAGTAILAPGQSRLTFNFELESWVEITDASGNVILSAINPAGSERVVVGTAPFSLVIGNASGVRLSYNGEPVKLVPHRVSDVARVTLE